MVRMAKKKTNFPNQKLIKVDFDLFASGVNTSLDESVSPLKNGRIAYNFNYSKGVLTTGMGVGALCLPQSKNDLSITRTLNYTFDSFPTNLHIYRFFEPYTNEHENRLVVTDDGGDFSHCAIFTPYQYYQKAQLNFTSEPCTMNYRYNGLDYMLFSSATDPLTMWTLADGFTAINNAPNATSMCMYNGKFFACLANETTSVFVVNSTNPNDWTTSSPLAFTIAFNDNLGISNKVVAFNNYLYVFRDYGITRINCYEGSTSYTLSNEYLGSSYIYPNTIAVYGDEIIFMTSDGVYRFNGATVTKLNLPYGDMFSGIDNRLAVADVYRGKYYLACKTTLEENASNLITPIYNSSLLEIDPNSLVTSVLYGQDIVTIKTIQDDKLEKLVIIKRTSTKNVICELTHDGCDFGVANTKVWYTSFTDLGFNEVKHLKSITLTCTNSCTLVVQTELGTETFSITGSDIPQKILLNINGVKVRIGFITYVASIKISRPVVELVR